MKLGFIGVGVMGRGIIRNLMRGGHELVLYNRSQNDEVKQLLAEGARWANSPSRVAQQTEVVFTMVGFPNDVEEVYLGPEGIFAGAAPGLVAVDLTTSSPVLAKKLAALGEEKGLAILDAPVSGGDIGAREGRLSVMVGGAQAVFEKMQPLFSLMGQTIVLQGGPGAGQYTKMVNQIVIASTMLGVVEALVYAKAAGLDQERVLDSIANGAAGSAALSNLGPRMLKGDFAPGFYVKHFIKDMKIALSSAAELELQLPGLALAHDLYARLAAAGGENEGTQALYKLYLSQQATR